MFLVRSVKVAREASQRSVRSVTVFSGQQGLGVSALAGLETGANLRTGSVGFVV